MIAIYMNALEQYKKDTGQYPSTAAGLNALKSNVDNVQNWAGPYILEHLGIATDPWGHRFHYESPWQHGTFDLYSYGADGLLGGTGENRDITSWDIEKKHKI